VFSPGLFAFADQEGPAVPPAGGAAGLPCLLSNNSDRIREEVTGNGQKRLSSIDRKRAEATRQNIQSFAARHGTSTGVMTVTFPDDLTTKDAQKRLANFKRRVLKEHFGESITVREFHKNGKPHFHLVIDCLGDVTTGFNWEYYDALEAWNKSGYKGRKPSGDLGKTSRLQELHDIINEKRKAYHLGRTELVPVRNPDAVGFYLGGYLSKSLDNKPDDAKGTRAVNYSHDAPRPFKGAFSWANESAWLWRAKLETWAEGHGCFSLQDVRSLFGPKWAYHHREAILSVRLTHYPTAKHALADGVEFEQLPPDAVDIVIETLSAPAPPAPAVSPFDDAWLASFSNAPASVKTDAVPLVVVSSSASAPRAYVLKRPVSCDGSALAAMADSIAWARACAFEDSLRSPYF